MKRYVFCLGLLLVAAWATKKPPQYELYLAPACIEEIHKLPTTDCHGPDLEHLLCPHVGASVVKGCAMLRVLK